MRMNLMSLCLKKGSDDVLTMELIALTDDFVSYKYFVEGKEEGQYIGEVIYSFKDKKFDLLKEAESDKFGRYSCHAFSRMRKYLKENHFESEDLVAWG